MKEGKINKLGKYKKRRPTTHSIKVSLIVLLCVVTIRPLLLFRGRWPSWEMMARPIMEFPPPPRRCCCVYLMMLVDRWVRVDLTSHSNSFIISSYFFLVFPLLMVILWDPLFFWRASLVSSAMQPGKNPIHVRVFQDFHLFPFNHDR